MAVLVVIVLPPLLRRRTAADFDPPAIKRRGRMSSRRTDGKTEKLKETRRITAAEETAWRLSMMRLT